MVGDMLSSGLELIWYGIVILWCDFIGICVIWGIQKWL